MFPVQKSAIKPDEFSRCEERIQIKEDGNSPDPFRKTDAAIKESVYHAFRKDDVLRAIEFDQIDVHVKNGVVYLSGHIVNTNSRNRIEAALWTIPGTPDFQNHLVLDDRLTHEVAISLGTLEHTYNCKFFTGVSHGLVSLNGIVSDEHVKLLAEKCAAAHPNVRGVINHVRVSGAEPGLPDQPFLQPAIGQIIYFLDGISGVVRQVIINPNNRRVVAMTVLGHFADQRQELTSWNRADARSPDHLVVVPMDVVRYLTRVSGFLHIRSDEKKRYMDFDPTHFSNSKNGWKAPYPYCPEDVLFPVEYQDEENQTSQQLPGSLLTVALAEPLLWEQLLANDSLGG
jgi:osmotically-inducible protein OsmY/uncharacterized protein YkvS